MSILQTLARMIGVREDQAEDALRCVPRAREAVVLSRRGFFAAGAVMAAAPLVPERLYSFGRELPFWEELEGIVHKLPRYYFDKHTSWSALAGGVSYPFIATGMCIVAVGPGEPFEV